MRARAKTHYLGLFSLAAFLLVLYHYAYYVKVLSFIVMYLKLLSIVSAALSCRFFVASCIISVDIIRLFGRLGNYDIRFQFFTSSFLCHRTPTTSISEEFIYFISYQNFSNDIFISVNINLKKWEHIFFFILLYIYMRYFEEAFLDKCWFRYAGEIFVLVDKNICRFHSILFVNSISPFFSIIL